MNADSSHSIKLAFCRSNSPSNVQVELIIHVFQLNDEGPADAEDGDEATPSYSEWQLPARAFCGLWESLIYGEVRPCFPGFCTETSRGCTGNAPALKQCR